MGWLNEPVSPVLRPVPANEHGCQSALLVWDNEAARTAVSIGHPLIKDRLKTILDVFSRRKAPRPQDKPDVISERLRNRILLLFREVFSGKWTDGAFDPPGDHTREFWEQMHNSLQHLYGRPRLSVAATRSPVEDAFAFVANCTTAEFFDFLELTFKTDAIWRVLHDENHLVEAVNKLLRVENAPYQLTPIVKCEEPSRDGVGRTIRTVAWPKVIRVEEEVTFVEAVAPALSVLSSPDYEAANLEFRDALDEYRKGHYGDCLAKCGSTFESVLKVLCKQNGWAFKPTDAAKPLLKTVLSHTKLDAFFEQPLILIATLRNRLSTAHGGGAVVRSPERHVAQYAITSTAAALVLLVREVGL